eukprot:403368060
MQATTSSGCTYFVLVTEKPLYSPGEMVMANIHVRVVTQIDASHIEIEIKGKERCQLNAKKYRIYYVNVNGRQESKRQYYYEQEKEKRKILEHRQAVFQFPTGTILPGDYVFPIQFLVPSGIPSTFSYANFDIQEQPQVQVKYSITCKMAIRSIAFVHKHKQPFIIQELLKSIQSDIHGSQEAKIVSGCCINQGISKIDVTFDKNAYYAHETAKTKITIDNSRCNLDMGVISLSIQQYISIQANGYKYSNSLSLINRTESGPKARYKKIEKELSLDLNQVQVKNQPTKFKDADLFMGVNYSLNLMQPACHGSLIKNEYNLAVNTDFNGKCTCCSKWPSVKTPVIVLPAANVMPHGIPAPQDFQPTVNEPAVLQISEIPHVSNQQPSQAYNNMVRPGQQLIYQPGFNNGPNYGNPQFSQQGYYGGPNFTNPVINQGFHAGSNFSNPVHNHGINTGSNFTNPIHNYGINTGSNFTNPVHNHGINAGSNFTNPVHNHGINTGSNFTNPIHNHGISTNNHQSHGIQISQPGFSVGVGSGFQNQAHSSNQHGIHGTNQMHNPYKPNQI